MAFASTDLIAVDRGGTAYQETFGNRSNIDTTDELMVEATTTAGSPSRVIGEKYKCSICGNEVTVTKVGGGELICCGQAMEKL